MKRLLMFMFVALFVLGSLATATETRVFTMGEANNVVKDDANIFLYPSTINFHPDLFIGEFGETSEEPSKYDDGEFWKAGLHLQFRADTETPITMGAYFSQEDYFHEVIYDYDKYPPAYADQKIDLYLGWYLMDLPWGFHFGLFGNGEQREGEPETSDYERSLSRMEFDFGGTLMDEHLDVAVGFATVSWDDKDWTTAPDEDGYYDMTKPDGNTEFYLRGRYWMNPMGRTILIPHAELNFVKQGIEDLGTDDGDWVTTETFTKKWTTIDLGIGTNTEPDEDILIITDFGIKFRKLTDEYDIVDPDTTIEREYKWNHLPYFRIGIDAEVFSWLDLRAGAYTYWYSNTNDYKDMEYEYKNSGATTNTYLGAGFHWNNLTLDAAIDTDFMERGPYFISGDDTSEMFGRLSLMYHF